MKPRFVPRRFFWASMISKCSQLISGITMGTSGVQRCALLLETTGVSDFAYRSSIARISSLDMFTAENTKSTSAAIESTSSMLRTTMFFTFSGIGVSIFHFPPTASSYVFPALRLLAARTQISYQGCSESSVIKRCPTIPVAPRIPTLNFSLITLTSTPLP